MKFGAEREVRSSPWGFSALTASRLDAPRVPENSIANDFPGRTDGPLTLATAMSDPGGPAGPAVPPRAPAATVWPQGADPSKAKQSKLSFARASKEGHELTQAVGLKERWAGLHSAERESELQPPADKQACPISSIRNLSWPSQWRFQISAQIHPIYQPIGRH